MSHLEMSRIVGLLILSYAQVYVLRMHVEDKGKLKKIYSNFLIFCVFLNKVLTIAVRPVLEKNHSAEWRMINPGTHRLVTLSGIIFLQACYSCSIPCPDNVQIGGCVLLMRVVPFCKNGTRNYVARMSSNNDFNRVKEHLINVHCKVGI